MRKYNLFLLACFMVNSAFAQNSFRSNTIYGEFLGNGIIASVNYEKQLLHKEGLGVRVGLGYYSGDEKFRFSFPVGVNYLFHLFKHKSFLDVGAGVTWSGAAGLQTNKQELTNGRDDGTIASFVPSIGYRHHTKHYFMWRVSFTPVINKYRVIPFPAISIGKRL